MGGLQVEFHTYRIAHSEVALLWMGVTRKAAINHLFFLTKDGSHIWKSLTKIGATPWACRVKWLASSGSNVYAVTMPCKHDGVLCINADQTAITYAMKIVHEDSGFEREKYALEELSTFDSELYAVGYVNSTDAQIFRSGADVEWQLGETVATNESGRASNCWWQSLEQNTKITTGGVIFMKFGLPWNGEEQAQQVCNGVITSLRMAHAANILHCDLRANNVLLFQCGWRLIDYGLSWRMDTNEKYDLDSTNGGGQAEGAGPRVRELLRRNGDIFWTIGDDYEMLLQMMGSLPA